MYRDLLDLYYDTEQPLPAGDIHRLARRVCCDATDISAMESVLSEFFCLQGDLWTHARCDKEIARYRGQIDTASRAGKASAQRRANARSTPVAIPYHQPEPEPEPKEREPRATRLPAPFVLEGEWREWAKAHRPDLDPDLTAAKFADYWHAKPTKDGRKLDWFATWRNWVREERPPKTSPIDVARQTVQAKPRSDCSYLNEAPMTPEQRQAANKARELAVSAFKTIRSAA